MSRLPLPRVAVSAPSVTVSRIADEVFEAWSEDYGIRVGYYNGQPRDTKARASMVSEANGEAGLFIYFAAAKRGPLKIGLSERPLMRVRAMPGYSVIAVVDGQNRDSELRLHDQFRDYRHPMPYMGVKYEWYQRSSYILELAYRLANAADSSINELFPARKSA